MPATLEEMPHDTSLREIRDAGKRARAAARSRRAARGRPRQGAGAGAGANHVPVLAGELVSAVAVQPDALVIDCTFGGGGHARLLAQQLDEHGTLVGIDRDPIAEQRFVELARDLACSVRFIRGDYVQGLGMLAAEGVLADGVCFDLGMSSMQVDTRERGFSYSYDAPLDMRMDPGQQLTARELVTAWDERQLRGALRELGEERHANAIARAIVRRRREAPIETTLQLVETINAAIPAPARFGAGHPAKRVFQALRIAVNDELNQLEQGLPLAWGLLRAGGVLAAISFHSLEDRRVKRFLAGLAQGCICPPDLPVCVCGHEPEAALLSKRSITPSSEEVARNPRAASARLRAARKLDEAPQSANPTTRRA